MKKAKSDIRAAAFVLALFILSASLGGCGMIIINTPPSQTEPESSESSDTGETEVETYTRPDFSATVAELEAALPTGNFDGGTFIITATDPLLLSGETAGDDGGELGEKLGGETLSKDIAERNRLTAERYNIKLVIGVSNTADITAAIDRSLKSDEYYTDLVYMTAADVGVLGIGGRLASIRSMPLIDTSAPYFNQSSVEAATGGYFTYGIAGYANIAPHSVNALYFNRDMFGRLGLEYPYREVTEGTWTWERLLAVIAEGRAADGEVGGIYSRESYNELERIVLSSGGGAYISSKVGEAPKVAFNGDTAGGAVSVLSRIYGENMLYGGEDGVSLFHSGGSMFLLDRLYAMDWMIDSVEPWGILPLPKLDPDQEGYRNVADSSATLFALPKGQIDSSRAACVLSAINAYSYGSIAEGYSEYLLYNTLRDQRSADMLCILLEPPVYDMTMVFSSVYGFFNAGTGELLRLIALGQGDFGWLYNSRVWTLNYNLSYYLS